jgi:hypothetical protein
VNATSDKFVFSQRPSAEHLAVAALTAAHIFGLSIVHMGVISLQIDPQVWMWDRAAKKCGRSSQEANWEETPICLQVTSFCGHSYLWVALRMGQRDQLDSSGSKQICFRLSKQHTIASTVTWDGGPGNHNRGKKESQRWLWCSLWQTLTIMYNLLLTWKVVRNLPPGFLIFSFWCKNKHDIKFRIFTILTCIVQ